MASFLHRVFVAPNVRVMSEADLAEAVEDELYSLREQLGPKAYPKGACAYLDGCAAPDKGWLRKFSKPGTDEAQFDLMPATGKAIAWLVSLTERPFVGTESRLLTLFALLEPINGRLEQLLRSHPFDSAQDLALRRRRAVGLCNEQLLKKALQHLTPLQAMKRWRRSHPHLSSKRVEIIRDPIDTRRHRQGLGKSPGFLACDPRTSRG